MTTLSKVEKDAGIPNPSLEGSSCLIIGAEDENKPLNLLSIVVLHGGWGSREKEEKSGDEVRFSRRGRGRERAGEVLGPCKLSGGRDKRTATTYLSKPISPAPRLSRINLINNPPEIFLEVYQVFSEDRMKS